MISIRHPHLEVDRALRALWVEVQLSAGPPGLSLGQYVLMGIAAFLGPGLFGWTLAPATGTLTPTEGLLLMLVIPGLSWIAFGPLCMAVNRWSLSQTLDVCLRAMAPGSVWLGLASAGFWVGGRWGWALLAVFIAHTLMAIGFVRIGKSHGSSTLRLSALWFLGLDGSAAVFLGVLSCV